jgi:hypothetical protein
MRGDRPQEQGNRRDAVYHRTDGQEPPVNIFYKTGTKDRLEVGLWMISEIQGVGDEGMALG